ncbi:MAG: HD domain-containing phosphohydrolase [Armatimonadota bacterium]|nr:HD domain-containing protein [bacterium]
MTSGHLLAAMSYMTDIAPEGCCCHSWRVALVGQRLASIVAPDQRRDVFYAGLLQDLGAVGAQQHITHYTSLSAQMADQHILTHPQRSAAIIEWLPGMQAVADLVRYHHEWWDGGAYPERRSGNNIPLGSQILRLADSVDTAGCFTSSSNLSSGLKQLAVLTGHAWSNDIWRLLIESLSDGEFYRSLMTPEMLPEMISKCCVELEASSELENEDSTERILHIFAAMVDLKAPATAGHSLRTARYAKSLAGYCGLYPEEVTMAYRAGLVHDCGRVGLPASLVNRSGRLTDKEKQLVRAHAAMTIRVLSCLPDCPEMIAIGAIAGHDHERYDGQGYPDKIAGNNIAPVSRVLSAVDAFDAMRAARSDRLLSPKAAVVRLQQGAGTQFDPEVVDAMVELVASGELEEQDAAA